MTIYIDADFKCYAELSADRRTVETDFFDKTSRIDVDFVCCLKQSLTEMIDILFDIQ